MPVYEWVWLLTTVCMCSAAEIQQLQLVAKKNELIVIPLIQTFGHFEVYNSAFFTKITNFHFARLFLLRYVLTLVVWLKMKSTSQPEPDVICFTAYISVVFTCLLCCGLCVVCAEARQVSSLTWSVQLSNDCLLSAARSLSFSVCKIQKSCCHHYFISRRMFYVTGIEYTAMSICDMDKLINYEHILVAGYKCVIILFVECIVHTWVSQLGALIMIEIQIMTFALQCRFNDSDKGDDWSSHQCTSRHNVVSHRRWRSMYNCCMQMTIVT